MLKAELGLETVLKVAIEIMLLNERVKRRGQRIDSHGPVPFDEKPASGDLLCVWLMATKKARSSLLPGLWSLVSRRWRFVVVPAPTVKRKIAAFLSNLSPPGCSNRSMVATIIGSCPIRTLSNMKRDPGDRGAWGRTQGKKAPLVFRPPR